MSEKQTTQEGSMKINISKEWSERMARLEGNTEIGAGLLALDPSTRRCDVLRLTPAEFAIRNAVIEVEKAGAEVRLTDAVVLLVQAQRKVADFVDEVPMADPTQQSTTTVPAKWLASVVTLLSAMAGEGIGMEGCDDPVDMMCDIAAHFGCEGAEDPWAAVTLALEGRVA